MDAVFGNFVDFRINHGNALAAYCAMSWINGLYRGFKVRFVIEEGTAPSWTELLKSAISKYQWNQVSVLDERCVL